MKKRLYIFDFDDTLITDVGKVYVVDKDNNKRPLGGTSKYHHYDLKPGESFDLHDFDHVSNKPTIHHEYMNLLKKHLSESVILTARQFAGPVREYMDSLGIKVPRIVAVGKDHDYHANAKRKALWIKNEIKTKGLDYVEFWDDNDLNIQEATKLIEEFPDIEIILHQVLV